MYFNELPIPKDPRWRRLLSVALFLGLLYAFRGLAPVLIIFVVWARSLGWASDRLFERTHLNRKHSIAGILALFVSGVAVGVFFFVKQAINFVNMVRTQGSSYIASLTESSVFAQLKARTGWDTSDITEKAAEIGKTAVSYLTEGAYIALFLFVGFVVAVIYLFEKEEMDDWLKHVDAKSIQGVMVRWLGYVGDAIAITVRLQVVVALFDAIVTLPVMIALGLPNPGLLFVMVLFAAMVPVVGGFLSCVVLCIVAYDTKGFTGVGVFLALAFVLGKVESYYLAPRLTASHVKMPAVVLLVSLLMFESVFGFWGFFMSFPALYVASRIAAEWKKEDRDLKEATEAAARAGSTPPPLLTPIPGSGIPSVAPVSVSPASLPKPASATTTPLSGSIAPSSEA
jgi:predicted PurR-regulated permease PerM